jgi:predicted Fe-Mo cluster-binding NifX family protein
MKIAITVWGNRISPVFDSANTLMIADVENSKITSRIFEEYDPEIPAQIISALKEHQVEVFICGAITDTQSKKIEQSGIKLISFISGNADKVLKAYITEKYRILDFLMPGIM